MKEEWTGALEQVFEKLAGCLFAEACTLCERHRRQKLDIANPLHRNDSINDLLERVARAEGDFLNLTEASEQQRKQLQETYALSAKEARRFGEELRAKSAAERGARQRPSTAHGPAPCVPVDWLIEFAALMAARGEMIRVLREMSENDALSDVQPGIEALAEAMRAIVRCHTDRAQADANTPPTPHLHVPYGSASTLKRSTSAASFSSYNSAWQIPNAPTNTASATSLSTTPHTHANTPHTNMHTPTPLTPSTSTGTLAVALQRESDEFQDSATQSSTLLVLKPFRDRVEDEVRVLLSLLQAYEGTMNYDFLACTQALYAANQCLKRIAASSRRGASAGPVTGGKTISEWWTQMDGYWGLNTTRALQQFLNAERCMDRREGDWDAVSVDSSFGPRTGSAHCTYNFFLNSN
jgi:hypothetical protein